MRHIRFEAKDIWGRSLGEREIEIGSGVVTAFAKEITITKTN